MGLPPPPTSSNGRKRSRNRKKYRKRTSSRVSGKSSKEGEALPLPLVSLPPPPLQLLLMPTTQNPPSAAGPRTQSGRGLSPPETFAVSIVIGDPSDSASTAARTSDGRRSGMSLPTTSATAAAAPPRGLRPCSAAAADENPSPSLSAARMRAPRSGTSSCGVKRKGGFPFVVVVVV